VRFVRSVASQRSSGSFQTGSSSRGQKPATAALATELKKDSKIYVTVYDRGGTTFFIEKLKTIPASFEVK